MTIPQADTAIRLAEQIAAVGVGISSIEWLFRRDLIRRTGLLSWDVIQLRERWMTNRWAAAIFGYRSVIVLLVSRLAGAVALILLPQGTPAAALLCCCLAACAIYLRVRLSPALDASDQMSMIVLIALSITRLAGTRLTIEACLWFLTAQACLAYCNAGRLKLESTGWRDGTYLARLSVSRTFGHPGSGRLLMRRPPVARGLSMGIVLLETLFPVVLLLPPSMGFGLLLLTATFHAASGLTMGLNTFLWSFGATYPAIIYCSGRIHV